MSLLDLNNGRGSSSRMKRGVKLWIGAGLVAAVVGIGSTLASSITLNGGNETEFGQGVAQTVYCGDNKADVMVTPISAYVNSETRYGHDAVPSVWVNPTWSGNPSFQEVSSSSSTNTFTSNYVNDATGESESVKGYWVSSRSSSNWYTSSNAPSSNYVFVPQAVGTSSTSYSSRSMSSSASGSNKYGYWKFTNWVAGSFTTAIAEEEDSEGPDSFELSGIAVSNIPAECSGVDFVVSVYSSGDEDPKYIVSNCDNDRHGDSLYSNEVDSQSRGCSEKATEIAVQWNNTDSTSPNWNIDRTGIISNPSWAREYLTVSTSDVVDSNTGGTIKILIDSDGSRLETDSVDRIVVETQDDLVA